MAEQDFELLFATGTDGGGGNPVQGVPNEPIDELDPIDGDFDPIQNEKVPAGA